MPPGRVPDAEGGVQGIRRLPRGQEIPRGRCLGLRERGVLAGGRHGLGEVGQLEDVFDFCAEVKADGARRVQVQFLFPMIMSSYLVSRLYTRNAIWSVINKGCDACACNSASMTSIILIKFKLSSFLQVAVLEGGVGFEGRQKVRGGRVGSAGLPGRPRGGDRVVGGGFEVGRGGQADRPGGEGGPLR